MSRSRARIRPTCLEGRIPACIWVRRALERQGRDLERENTPGFPYWFDPAAARQPCQIAELLPHIKGPDAFVVGRDSAGRDLWNPLVLSAVAMLDPNDRVRMAATPPTAGAGLRSRSSWSRGKTPSPHLHPLS